MHAHAFLCFYFEANRQTPFANKEQKITGKGHVHMCISFETYCSEALLTLNLKIPSTLLRIFNFFFPQSPPLLKVWQAIS
jgi:hypothetical protein